MVISGFVVHFFGEKHEPKFQPHPDPQAFLKSLSAESHKVGKLLVSTKIWWVDPIMEFRGLFGVYLMY